MDSVKTTLIALGFVQRCQTCDHKTGRRVMVAHIEEKGIFKKNECVEAEFRTVRCLVCGNVRKMELISYDPLRFSFFKKGEIEEFKRYVCPFLIRLINDPNEHVDKNLIGDLCEILG